MDLPCSGLGSFRSRSRLQTGLIVRALVGANTLRRRSRPCKVDMEALKLSRLTLASGRAFWALGLGPRVCGPGPNLGPRHSCCSFYPELSHLGSLVFRRI